MSGSGHSVDGRGKREELMASGQLSGALPGTDEVWEMEEKQLTDLLPEGVGTF